MNHDGRIRKAKTRAGARGAGRTSAGIRGRLSLDKDGEPFLGPARIDLLQAVEREGSISAAARAIGLSYRAAWDAIEAMNNRAAAALVSTAVGGSGGGGALLTEYGRKVVQLVTRIEAQYADTLAVLNDPSHDVMAYQRLVRRFSLRTSARNQWLGTIVRVEQGLVQARVVISLGAAMDLGATLSSESVRELELSPGSEVWALVKATAVSMEAGVVHGPGDNRWTGIVRRVQAEPTHASLTAEMACGRTVTAILSSQADEPRASTVASAAVPLREQQVVTIVVPPSSVTLVVAD